DRLVLHLAHVALEQRHARGPLGPELREALRARPGKGTRVDVHPECAVLGVGLDPGTAQRRGAAEVLAQSVRIAVVVGAVHALEQRDVAFRVLHGRLVQIVEVDLLRLRLLPPPAAPPPTHRVFTPSSARSMGAGSYSFQPSVAPRIIANGPTGQLKVSTIS